MSVPLATYSRALLTRLARATMVVAIREGTVGAMAAAIRASSSPWAAQPTTPAPKTATRGAVRPESTGYSATEMAEGYLDGLDRTNPEPSGNRSASYRHGFLNARADITNRPRATYARLLELAEEARAHDEDNC